MCVIGYKLTKLKSFLECEVLSLCYTDFELYKEERDEHVRQNLQNVAEVRRANAR